MGHLEDSLDVSFLVGVIEDALGFDSFVGPVIRVGALLEPVAIIANKRLSMGLKVVDAVADVLFPPVGWYTSMATSVAATWAVDVSTVLSRYCDTE